MEVQINHQRKNVCVLGRRKRETHLFLAQLDLALLDDVFFVQQFLLLTFKVVFALRRKTSR